MKIVYWRLSAISLKGSNLVAQICVYIDEGFAINSIRPNCLRLLFTGKIRRKMFPNIIQLLTSMR